MEKNSTQSPTIEQEIGLILELINTNAKEETVARRDKLSKWTSCRGIIGVYSRAALEREQKGGPRAHPSIQYAFYPHPAHPSRLGSVALYGEDIAPVYHSLRCCGALFGHRIVALSMEMGRRPFIDVTLGC